MKAIEQRNREWYDEVLVSLRQRPRPRHQRGWILMLLLTFIEIGAVLVLLS